MGWITKEDGQHIYIGAGGEFQPHGPTAPKKSADEKEPHELTRAEYVGRAMKPSDKAKATRAAKSTDEIRARLAAAEEEYRAQSKRGATGGGRIQDQIDREKSAAAGKVAGLKEQLKRAGAASNRPDALAYMHETAVRNAIKEGKPVSAHVLKDYPHLAPPAPAAPAAIGPRPGEKFSLVQRSATGSKGPVNVGRGTTKFMFDINKRDLPGQTSMFDKHEAQTATPAARPSTHEAAMETQRQKLQLKFKSATTKPGRLF